MYRFDLKALAAARRARWSGVGPNVLLLGLTSLFTDISAEMVTAILPIYLVFFLHVTPLQLGIVEGLYQGAAAIVRIGGGVLADRWQRNREIAAAGYALSAVCKLGLLAAGNAWTTLSGVLVVDRVGKAIRTAPRDALIALASAPSRLGLAFGVHRALDTVGALLGPLVAFAILLLLPDAYDVVFVSSFFIALIGLATLLLFVGNPARTSERINTERASFRAAAKLLRQSPFRAIVITGSVLGMATVGDSFLYLALQRSLSLDLSVFPLLYVATAVTFLALAIPAGRLADRVGRGRVFLWGHGLLILAYIAVLIPDLGASGAVLCLALLGAYYACTDGVLMSLASALLPTTLRTSGLALLGTAIGLTRFLASVIFGAIWGWWSLEIAIAVFVVGLSVAILLVWPTLTRNAAVR